MFRTSCVHQQVDHLYMQFFVVCFSCVCVSSLTGGRMFSSICYAIKTACTNGLPDDKHMMFKTYKP